MHNIKTLRLRAVSTMILHLIKLRIRWAHNPDVWYAIAPVVHRGVWVAAGSAAWLLLNGVQRVSLLSLNEKET